MQLQLNLCTDELDLSICNQSSSNQCEGGGSSRPLAERSASCVADSSSRVSVRNSDLMMITSVNRDNSVTMAGACTRGSWSNPSADLNDSIHAAVSRQDDSSGSSRQPRMIFSSSSGATADHERGGWSPRCYACSFCGREFNSAQALGGHMNIHRRDRARLRTSTSPASIPHDQADLPPALQNSIQYPAPSSLYESFNEAALIRENENPSTAISSSLNVTYTAPNIISAAPTFSLLDIRPAAPDPTFLTLAACPSQDEIPAAPFSVPLVDLALPFVSSSAIRLSKIQSEAHSLFSNIAPHASPLFIRPSLESSSLKHVEALNRCAGQASGSRQDCPDCEAASKAHLIQFSQSKGGTKRARENDPVNGVTTKSTVGHRCRHERSFAEKSNSLCAARPFVKPNTPDVKGLLCLDLELRLGQSSPSDSDGAGDCCRPSTTATPAPRPPA